MKNLRDYIDLRSPVLFAMKGPDIVTFDDGTRIDMSHHFEVWKERKLRGMSVEEVTGKYLQDHTMVKKHVKCKKTGDIYEVEFAMKQWYCGRYVTLLLSRNGSSRMVIWENIDCSHPTILANIEEAHAELEVVEEAAST